jgi:hypothetical protein
MCALQREQEEKKMSIGHCLWIHLCSLPIDRLLLSFKIGRSSGFPSSTCYTCMYRYSSRGNFALLRYEFLIHTEAVPNRLRHARRGTVAGGENRSERRLLDATAVLHAEMWSSISGAELQRTSWNSRTLAIASENFRTCRHVLAWGQS